MDAILKVKRLSKKRKMKASDSRKLIQGVLNALSDQLFILTIRAMEALKNRLTLVLSLNYVMTKRRKIKAWDTKLDGMCRRAAAPPLREGWGRPPHLLREG